ncbi:fused MFS/spermidine synthase [Methylobacterium nodulans]|nr:fused MFS/spermidine synthase [Methylobacterium nodulans]
MAAPVKETHAVAPILNSVASNARGSVRLHTGYLGVTLAALFLSAFLLFSVQPLFTKMVLPIFGGSPATWSAALVFFQAALLGGYLYAHLLARFLAPRRAVALHFALMTAALLTLPFHLPTGWEHPPAQGEALWVLGLFTVAIGPPFFALAANGPLLQAWFARSNHPRARDPYFLYATSNIGSFAALLAYPVLIEPLASLRLQAVAWAVGFAMLAALVTCAGCVTGQAGQSDTAASGAPTTWRCRAAWVGLAFVPSGLLVAVTAHISTDVAAAPLLWVVPLALFLLTFVIAFRDGAARMVRWLAPLQAWGTALAILSLLVNPGLWASLGLHLGLFFVNACLCHTALYRVRPGPAHLTEYYICIALGGVLGGVTCGLLAPHLFSSVLEYPFLLGAALICRPGNFLGVRTDQARAIARAALVCGLLTALVVASGLVTGADGVGTRTILALCILLLVPWKAPLQTTVTGLAALVAFIGVGSRPVDESVRSFFGVHSVATSPDGRFRLLKHGTTLHGAMRLFQDDGTPADRRPEPLLYYAPAGPMGVAIRSVRAARGGSLGRVAVIGLGSGSLACAAQESETWTFLEIDPAVIRIARDPARFRFLSECGPAMPIVLGDARRTLAEQPADLGLILFDAFSSDAIPAHLLTEEAVRLALSKLDRTGVLLFHISNRHLDLSRILARVGADLGLTAWLIQETGVSDLGTMRAAVKLLVLARDPAHLGSLLQDPSWRRVLADPDRRPWTDNYSNILQAVLDQLGG